MGLGGYKRGLGEQMEWDEGLLSTVYLLSFSGRGRYKKAWSEEDVNEELSRS